MDISLEYFKATIKRRKDRKEKYSGKFNWKILRYNIPYEKYNFPKLSEEELYIIKNRIREKIKADNLKNTMLSALIVLVIITVVIIFILKN